MNAIGTSSEPVQIQTEGDWAEYTPVFTNANEDAEIGDGIIQGRYRINGAMLDIQIQLNVGATTTFGTAGVNFSLPEGIDPALSKMFPSGIPQSQWGVALDDTGPAGFPIFIGGVVEHGAINPDTPALCILFSTASVQQVAAANPFVWAVNDIIMFGFSLPWTPYTPVVV